MKNHHRITASVVLFFFIVTGVVNDLTGIDLKKAFAMPSSYLPMAGQIGDLKSQASVTQNFHTDLFTGAAQFTVPIFTPPGRRGVTPQLALGYSSSSGNSWLGVGWGLDQGFIRRSLKNGVPTYNDSQDTFTLLVNGVNSDLVKVSGNEYHVKDENGEFLRVFFENGYWRVLDKSGTEYTFGQSTQARGQNQLGIFCWCLEKIKDRLGNTMTYQYTVDQGEMYLARIDYNGNDDQNFLPTHSVEFILENRPDVSFAYLTGSKITQAKRLKQILVKVSDQLSRSYTLSYEQSPAVGHSRLKQVQECGTDGTTCLPVTKFTYQDQTFGFKPGVVWNQPSAALRAISVGADEETVSTVDMNGDGMPDRVEKDGSSFGPPATGWKVYKNTGSGFATQAEIMGPIEGSQSSSWSSIRGDSNGNACYTNLMDLNRDGRPDRVVKGYSGNQGGSTGWAVQYAQGNQFTAQSYFGPTMQNNDLRSGQWYHPDDHGGTVDRDTYRTLWDVVDMNGDGYADRVHATDSNYWEVYWGSAAGFSQSPYTWSNVQGNPHPGWGQIRLFDACTGNGAVDLIDLNGDGLPDRIIGGGANPGGSTGFAVQYNTGRGFEDMQYFGPLPYDTAVTRNGEGVPDDHPNTIRMLIDINQDGRPDRLEKVNDSTWVVLFNTGTGFTPPVNWGPIEGYQSVDKSLKHTDSQSVIADLMDINGDGMIDRVISHPGDAKWLVQAGYETVPDLLKVIENGRGGKTTIEYQPSTHYYNGGSDGVSDLAFPVMTVISVTHEDGLGNSVTTEYDYADGKYDGIERAFLGFNRSRIIDALGNYTDTWFHQDNVLKGKSYLTEIRDWNGNLFRQRWNTWQSIELYPGSHFAYVTENTDWIYDGNATSVINEKNFSYDAYGNVIETIDWGQVDPNNWDTFNGDEVITKVQYAYGPDNWVMDKPKHTETYDYNWNRIQESWFYYDGAQDFNVAPINGLLTKKEDLPALNQPRFNVQMTYDNYGNMVTAKDARNQTTVNEYDPIFHLYMTKVTNVLGHARMFVYDPLVGQITDTTDQNGQVSKTKFDVLGRPIKSISPYDTESAPTQAFVYDDNYSPGNPTRVITHLKSDANAPSLTMDDQPHTGYLTSYLFIDGLGREAQKRAPAENSSQQIVSDYLTYNERGQILRQYAPYSATFRTTFAGPPSEIPYASFEYDVMGRRTLTTYPDGSTSSATFDDLQQISIDQKGHQKRNTKDTYGNLVKVEECVNAVSSTPFCSGGTVYITTFEYDRLNRLVKTTNAFGHVTEIHYDMLGRKTFMSDPNLGAWSYGYDANDNLASQTDAKNQTITFQYDLLNRLTKKTYPDTTHVDYTYDSCPSETCGGLSGENYPLGRLLKIEDNSGVQLFRYDRLGRVIEDQKSPDDGQNYSFTRIYDPLGRATALQYPDGEILTLTFNGMGEAETLSLVHTDQSQVSIITNVDYTPANQIAKIAYGNGVVSDYTYNPRTLRLEHLLTSHQSQALQDFTYQFDNNGNVQSITDAINTNTQAFQYDDLDRLTQAVGSYGTHTFQYNPIGNMTQKAGATLSYNDPLHPQAVTAYQKGTEGILYAYDRNGNMVRRGSDELIYDYDNRLIATKKLPPGGGCSNLQMNGNLHTACMEFLESNNPPMTAQSVYDNQYVYDASGQRVKKVTSNQTPSTNNKTTYYLGKDYEVEYNSTGSFSRKAFFLGDTRVAELEVQDAQGSVPHLRFFHQDHLGSTNLITNEQGDQTLLMEYLPYGEVKRREGTDKVQNTFTGQKSDSETGLMYYNARYYDPKVGRFITADPSIQNPDDPQTHNRYAYARNNPIRYVDPTGLSILSQILGFLAGIITTILTGNPIAGAAVYGFINATVDSLQKGANFKVALTKGLISGVTTAIAVAILGPVGGKVGGALGSALAKPLGTALGKAVAGYAEVAVQSGISFAVVQGGEAGITTAFEGGNFREILNNTGSAAFSGLIQGTAFGLAGRLTTDVFRSIRTEIPGLLSKLGIGGGADKLGAEAKIAIGETQRDVNNIAGKFGAETFQPDSNSTKSLMAQNRRWIFTKIREGRKIIDIGLDPTRATRSEFYRMEQKAIRRSDYTDVVHVERQIRE